MFRIATLIFALVSALSAREFDSRRDVFAFSNDTAPDRAATADGRLRMGRDSIFNAERSGATPPDAGSLQGSAGGRWQTRSEVRVTQTDFLAGPAFLPIASASPR